MHMTGYVIDNSETYIIDSCLFDTGASSDNYISDTYVTKYISIFKPYILAHNSTVKLGDSTTKVNITHIITLNISFLDNNSITHEALLNFSIMHMEIDMIIGINSILFSFFDLFIDMLKVAKSHQSKQFNFKLIQGVNTFNPYQCLGPPPNQVSTNITNNTPHSNFLGPLIPSPERYGGKPLLATVPLGVLNSLQATYPTYPSTSNAIPLNNPDYANCQPTWTIPIEGVAPEELEFPDPCSFSGPLMYISVDRQSVLDTYHAQLLSNINPDFIAACPAVLTFMKSDIALSVFCPEGWHGLRDIPDLDLEVSPLCPTRTYHRPRMIKPILLENAKAEFDRLCKYMYVPSNSPIASPLVIAPKPTHPFCRFCGDYVELNKFIIFMQLYIPMVMHELEKAAKGNIFLDFDMKNAFHQITLSLATSLFLSICTPWGTVRPLFMPEGISPASGILHTVMSEILNEWLDCAIVIFDNFLVVCNDFTDAYNKLVGFVTTCSKRNVILGMAKTKLGYPQVVFFGYLIKDGTYRLTDSRIEAVCSLVMPKTQKQAQSVCGSAIFFAKNIITFASICAPLNDMCTKAFDWNPKTWIKDYVGAFESLKEAIKTSIAITFPNYDLPFIIRTDASDIAWGAVLIQVQPGGAYECIALESGKWSDTACKWDIEKKEACAIVLAFKKMSYILTGKYTIIETDNKNLLFMETATSSIIKRWRVYLQGFHTTLRHILAKFNTLSDWLTRQYHLYTLYMSPDVVNDDVDDTLTSTLYHIHDENATDTDVFFTAVLNILVPKSHTDSDPDPLPVTPVQTPPTLTLTDMFSAVHGGKKFHRGVKQTWLALNEAFPGHAIPIRLVSDMISECVTCQKVRLSMNYQLPSENLHLKPPYYRKRVGIDTLTITPVDKFGNYLLIVIVEHFSKFVSLHPVPDHSAENTARALFSHYVTYGKFEQVISDPGSDLMSHCIILLNNFLGQEKLVSIVDWHPSNGVEPTNKKLLAFVRQLTQDLRISHQWSDPTIIQLIAHACNSMLHSETNYSPMELKFGSADLPYMMLPDNEITAVHIPPILQQLNDNIKIIRELSHTYQQQLVVDRDNSSSTQNKYQPGDLVLFVYSVTGEALTKTSSKYLGPYKVTSHVRNDVSVRNLITDAISVFHSSRLKPFFGTYVEAKEAALRDTEQYQIDHFIAYRGDPNVRTTVEFYILFVDGSYHWKQWSPDLFDTIQYEEFCTSIPQLFPLIYLTKIASTLIREINIRPILTVSPGTTVFMDLRAIGAGWYESLHLPNCDFSVYVVPLTYTGWQNTQHTKIQCSVPSLDFGWIGRNSVNTFFVQCYGNCVVLQPNMTLITYDFILEHDLINKYKNNQ